MIFKILANKISNTILTVDSIIHNLPELGISEKNQLLTRINESGRSKGAEAPRRLQGRSRSEYKVLSGRIDLCPKCFKKPETGARF
jgi:hypothetical protein